MCGNQNRYFISVLQGNQNCDFISVRLQGNQNCDFIVIGAASRQPELRLHIGAASRQPELRLHSDRCGFKATRIATSYRCGFKASRIVTSYRCFKALYEQSAHCMSGFNAVAYAWFIEAAAEVKSTHIHICCLQKRPLSLSVPKGPSTLLPWFNCFQNNASRNITYIPITNYQMAPSKRGAGGGSATHKEPT